MLNLNLEIAGITLNKDFEEEIKSYNLPHFAPIIDNQYEENRSILDYDEFSDIITRDCIYEADAQINKWVRVKRSEIRNCRLYQQKGINYDYNSNF